MPVLDSSSDGSGRAAKVGTFAAHLDLRLSRLLRSLGQDQNLPNSRRVARVLTSSWANELVPPSPSWASDITDDHSPFEFSLALNGREAKVRILTEPQDPHQPSLRSCWRLANDLHETLAGEWGANLASYESVAQLFEPNPASEAAFSVWHAAILGSRRDTQFKVYLNPAIHGSADAEEVVSQAMLRLGLADPWQALREHALRRTGLDQVIYFSLDLTRSEDARAKVYVAHRQASSADVAAALTGCSGFDKASLDRWLECLMGGSGPYYGRPPISCFALGRNSRELYTTTLHLPVRCYAADDFEIARQVCKFLGFPQRVAYMRALTHVAERPLESGPGLQTYVSLRPSPSRQAVTVYLAPQIYAPAPTRSVDPALGLFSSFDEPRSLVHAAGAVPT